MQPKKPFKVSNAVDSCPFKEGSRRRHKPIESDKMAANVTLDSRGWGLSGSD